MLGKKIRIRFEIFVLFFLDVTFHAAGLSKQLQGWEPAPVTQLDAPSDWRPGGCGFIPSRGQHSFVEIDLEIFSTVILSLVLIQEGQLSVSGKRMCTILVNHLED